MSRPAHDVQRTSGEVPQEFLEYFRSRPVYRRLFTGFRKKYESLGRFGGSVVLSGLSEEEKRQLGGFLQKDYSENKSVTVSAALMEKALSSCRYAGLTWEKILEAYFGEPLTIKKEQRRREKEERECFFDEILKSDFCAQGHAAEGRIWLEETLSAHTDGYAVLMQQYQQDPVLLSDILRQVLRAIGQLPVWEGKRTYLPVFAAEVTGDPHFFDPNTTAEKLLSAFLRNRFEKTQGTSLSNAEYKNALYYEAGLLRDEISNDVTVYGIRAKRKDGSVHAGIDGFYACREPVKLTLQTLGTLGSVCAGSGKKEVYVVENPAVFSYLAARYPDSTLICGNGQMKLAVLVLMDLMKEDHVFYYAGDYDPEGLLIAQRLKLRYGDGVRLWQYDIAWYRAYHSGVLLNEERLKKLDRICLEELRALSEEIKKTKKAAYQEAMLSVYEIK